MIHNYLYKLTSLHTLCSSEICPDILALPIDGQHLLLLSLPVSVSLFLLSRSPSFPPCLTYTLTRPHLSSSLNRESVFLQCGSLPGIMEMVKSFLWLEVKPTVSEACPSLSSPLDTLLPGMHSGWGQGAQGWWPEEPRDSCCLFLPAVCSEAGITNIFWRCWEDVRVPSKHGSSSESKKGPQIPRGAPSWTPRTHRGPTEWMPTCILGPSGAVKTLPLCVWVSP